MCAVRIIMLCFFFASSFVVDVQRSSSFLIFSFCSEMPKIARCGYTYGNTSTCHLFNLKRISVVYYNGDVQNIDIDVVNFALPLSYPIILRETQKYAIKRPYTDIAIATTNNLNTQ